jgi:hypothetical protein
VRFPSALLLSLALTAAGCARNRRDEDAANAPAQRQRNVMSITEIQEGQAIGLGNVYDLLVRYHPEWLRTVRATTGSATPTVWIDLQRMGGLSVLRTMPIGGVTLLRYLTPPEARGELGFDNPGGAIVVSMR